MMRIPFVDLRRDVRDDRELEAAFRRVLQSGKYILGEEVEAFERECARVVFARHAIGVSSGTDALLASLMALGIGPSDEVICPAYTFIATATAASRLGATPVFADVRPCCFGLDADDAARRITRKTRAIIVVHPFGQVAHLEAIERVAREHGIALVEDAAQSIGAPQRVAGRVSCLSFFPSKNIGALGDAGLVATDDDELAAIVRSLRVHGAVAKNDHVRIGGNFRMDALQAALLRVKLRRMDEITNKRRANATLYDELLAGATGVSTPKRCSGAHVFNQYIVRSNARDALRSRLADASIETAIYYPRPLHEHACFAHLPRTSLPVAEEAARTTLALPIFPELTEEEIRHVASQVASSTERSK